jgi:hypothetical protein
MLGTGLDQRGFSGKPVGPQAQGPESHRAGDAYVEVKYRCTTTSPRLVKLPTASALAIGGDDTEASIHKQRDNVTALPWPMGKIVEILKA